MKFTGTIYFERLSLIHTVPKIKF